MPKLLLLFTVVPLVELWLLVVLADAMGFWSTVALVLVTGVLGAWLAKREGLRVLGRWREDLAAGRVPEEGVLGGVLVLIGGVLLVTPGVLTDLTGLMLLFPPTRALVARAVRHRLARGVRDGSVQVVSFADGASFTATYVRTSADVRNDADRPAVIDVEGEAVAVRSERPMLDRE